MIGFLNTEGLHAIEGELANVDTLFAHGFRMAGLAHFFDNEVAGSAHGEAKGGLTPLGRTVVARIRSLGMLVDPRSARPVRRGARAGTGRWWCEPCGVGPAPVRQPHRRPAARAGGEALIGIGFWDLRHLQQLAARRGEGDAHAVDLSPAPAHRRALFRLGWRDDGIYRRRLGAITRCHARRRVHRGGDPRGDGRERDPLRWPTRQAPVLDVRPRPFARRDRWHRPLRLRRFAASASSPRRRRVRCRRHHFRCPTASSGGVRGPRRRRHERDAGERGLAAWWCRTGAGGARTALTALHAHTRGGYGAVLVVVRARIARRPPADARRRGHARACAAGPRAAHAHLRARGGHGHPGRLGRAHAAPARAGRFPRACVHADHRRPQVRRACVEVEAEAWLPARSFARGGAVRAPVHTVPGNHESFRVSARARREATHPLYGRATITGPAAAPTTTRSTRGAHFVAAQHHLRR
ncbi:MAG: membrane dipeptidase [Gemmatimonadetes bacterium]|nr:membrane dipeptidase [Gemmatimonadota bacterium]